MRHPFDRLVSAYIDKIKGPASSEYYQEQKAVIERMFKKVTFDNFLQYVLRTFARPDPHWIPFYKVCDYCDQSFPQYVGRLETFDRDIRWLNPLTKKSYPIRQNYFFRYIVRTHNLSHLIPVTEHSNETPEKVTSGKEDLEESNQFGPSPRTQWYFRNTSKEIIQKLYQLYRPDFELFKYSIKELL